jgi:hypothetical protein
MGKYFGRALREQHGPEYLPMPLKIEKINRIPLPSKEKTCAFAQYRPFYCFA